MFDSSIRLKVTLIFFPYDEFEDFFSMEGIQKNKLISYKDYAD